MERYDGGSDKFRGRDGLRVTAPRHTVPLLEKMIARGPIGLRFNPTRTARPEGIGMRR
jgi:choline dehydrogenase